MINSIPNDVHSNHSSTYNLSKAETPAQLYWSPGCITPKASQLPDGYWGMGLLLDTAAEKNSTDIPDYQWGCIFHVLDEKSVEAPSTPVRAWKKNVIPENVMGHDKAAQLNHPDIINKWFSGEGWAKGENMVANALRQKDLSHDEPSHE